MSDNNTPVTERVESTETGVKVTCKSKRGSGTDDRDSVTLVANYDSESEAYNKIDIRTNVVRRQMSELRKMDDEGMNTR